MSELKINSALNALRMCSGFSEAVQAAEHVESWADLMDTEEDDQYFTTPEVIQTKVSLVNETVATSESSEPEPEAKRRRTEDSPEKQSATAKQPSVCWATLVRGETATYEAQPTPKKQSPKKQLQASTPNRNEDSRKSKKPVTTPKKDSPAPRKNTSDMAKKFSSLQTPEDVSKAVPVQPSESKKSFLPNTCSWASQKPLSEIVENLSKLESKSVVNEVNPAVLAVKTAVPAVKSALNEPKAVGSWAERLRGSQSVIIPKPVNTLVARKKASKVPTESLPEAEPPALEEEKTLPKEKCQALWIGSLKVRHDENWLMDKFGPYKIQRVLHRSEGFAICQFPTELVAQVIEEFNNLKVDGKKFVVKESKFAL